MLFRCCSSPFAEQTFPYVRFFIQFFWHYSICFRCLHPVFMHAEYSLFWLVSFPFHTCACLVSPLYHWHCMHFSLYHSVDRWVCFFYHIFLFFWLLFILRFISLASQIALALIECQLCNLSLYWCSRFRFNTFESNWFLTWLLLYGFNHRRIVWISASELNQMNQPIIIISITYVVIEKEFCCWWCSWWGEHPRINSNTHKGCINTEATTFNRHFLTTWHIYEKATTKNIKMIKKTHTSFRTEAAHILEILHILTRVFTEVDMFHKMSTHIPTRYSVAPSFSQFNYIVWKYSAYIEFIWWLS